MFIEHIDTKRIIVVRDKRHRISFFQTSQLNKYYRLDEPKVYMIIGWVEQFHKNSVVIIILAG